MIKRKISVNSNTNSSVSPMILKNSKSLDAGNGQPIEPTNNNLLSFPGLDKQFSTNLTPAVMERQQSTNSSCQPDSLRINGKKFNMKSQISKSSVNYFILSFLTPLQVVRLGQLNDRYYKLYVPTVLATMTIGGTVPCSNSRRLTFAIRLESSANMILMDVPRSGIDGAYGKRDHFWKSLNWHNQCTFTKFKRNKRRNDVKPYNFNKVSWSATVNVEYYTNVEKQKVVNGVNEVFTDRQLQSYIYVMGGL